MKNALCSFLLVLACGFQWPTAYAEFYDDAHLDTLLDATDLIEQLREKVEIHKKASGYNFDPEDLSLIGALARRQYERQIQKEPIDLDEVVKNFVRPAGRGRIRSKDLVLAHRFETVLAYTHQRLRDVYQNRILEKPVRVLNNVGEVFGIMEIYSCAPTEYLAMFGTQMQQRGYSGAYSFMRVWDVMVDGKMRSHGIERNTTLPIYYGPGDVSLLEKEERRFYKMNKGTLMLDYGRGFIAPELWQGVVMPFFKNGDSASFGAQLGQCIKSIAGNVLSR